MLSSLRRGGLSVTQKSLEIPILAMSTERCGHWLAAQGMSSQGERVLGIVWASIEERGGNEP